MGSTLADLASYIRSQGGEIAGSVVLVNAMRGGKITADAKTVRELEARHGDEIRKLFGIEPSALTGPEAQYLIGFRTTDELRNRVAAARLERIARLREKGALPESQDSRGDVTRFSRSTTPTQQPAQTVAERAKAEGRTKLNYFQWVQVRTPAFKKWFGYWEAAYWVKRLAAKDPMDLDDAPALADKKSIEIAFRSFGEVKNKADGRSAVFPVNMAGKIVRHKGFDVRNIAGAFDRLFADAVPMVSEVEHAKDGGKQHPEIAAPGYKPGLDGWQHAL